MPKELKILLGITLITALVIGIAVMIGGQNTTAKIDTSVLVRSDSHQTNPGAKVTIVEFGDYQCPACSVTHPFIKQALSDYEGKINFVFRNFPLSQHGNALISAEAAEAAGKQGKYWEMHTILYEKQDEWSGLADPMKTLISYAQSLGLNIDQFKKEVENQTYKDFIQKDTDDGVTVGIDATPTFYINGTKMVGISNYESLKKIIDAQLAQ